MSAKIRYKVVNKNRKSVIIPSNFLSCITYEKDTIVEANKDTIGIFLFNRKKDAENFRNNALAQKILKVEPIGRGKIPKQIVRSVYLSNKSIKNLKIGIEDVYKTSLIPKGTICYPAVKVLN